MLHKLQIYISQKLKMFIAAAICNRSVPRCFPSLCFSYSYPGPQQFQYNKLCSIWFIFIYFLFSSPPDLFSVLGIKKRLRLKNMKPGDFKDRLLFQAHLQLYVIMTKISFSSFSMFKKKILTFNSMWLNDEVGGEIFSLPQRNNNQTLGVDAPKGSIKQDKCLTVSCRVSRLTSLDLCSGLSIK